MLLSLGMMAWADDPPQVQPKAPDKPESARYHFSGPYTHANLTIFLIHGADRLKGKSFLTLQEALAQKKVIVYETQNVNQLAIENVSSDEVFVQSGDIIKGGQQDRLIAYDLILPAKSGKMPVASFCVEHGRWTQRGKEKADRFEVSNAQAPTKDLKLATRQQMQQQAVWINVAKAQQQLGKKLGKPVLSKISASSLQLSLEDKKLQETVAAYVKDITPLPDKHNDVIGFAAVINGKVASAEIYGAHGLFMKLWPLLVKATATEAIAELEPDRKIAAVTAVAVSSFLADAERGKSTTRDVTPRVTLRQHESKESVLFESRDAQGESAPVRQSYLRK
jgi:hypothetical protein